LQLRGPGAGDLILWGRTFTTQQDGSTFGQDVPSPGADEVIGSSGGSLVIPGLLNSAAFRSNVIICETAGVDTRVTVQAYAEDGSPVGVPLSSTVKAYATWTITRVFRALFAGVEQASVIVTSAGGGQIVALGSVLDNVTNDPTTVMGKLMQVPAATSTSATASALYLPAVAHAPGLYGTQWRSNLCLFKRGGPALPIDVTIEYIPDGGSVTLPQQKTVTLGNLAMLIKPDVVGWFGVTSGKGTLKITSSSLSAVVASARTYTVNNDGSTYGQGYAAIRDTDSLTDNAATLYLVGLEESARTRSNVGLVNMGEATASVSVSATIPGQAERAFSLALVPGQLIQFTRLLATALGFSGDNANAVVKVKVLGSAGRVLAYASMIDNQSQDAVFVPGRKR
jgi:hypothetical protein